MYDTIIIGAGMSGLAAGIRLAHYDQRVCILERHSSFGGLNSFYRLRGRNFDVGLHAVTNYGSKHTPLARILRQLRLDWDDFFLAPQVGSRIAFPGLAIEFNNGFELLRSEVRRHFPSQIDGFDRLIRQLVDYGQVGEPGTLHSAREAVGRLIDDPLLVEMLFCPLLFYGSSRERDLDFGQFSVLFRSIFVEGLGRPAAGVRQILKTLVRKFKACGGQLKLRTGVRRIVVSDGQVQQLVLDDGSELTARRVLSSAGWPETVRLCADVPLPAPTIGRVSFVESISVLDRPPRDLGVDRSIVFFNDSSQFHYARPEEPVDVHSGVICSPDNFEYDEPPDVRLIRVSSLANYDRWAALEPDAYRLAKREWFDKIAASAVRFVPDFRHAVVDTDMFTPTTIARFTGHENGAVYGSPEKRYDGSTPVKNLFLCGTDQGLIGIVGAMMSGIGVANRHLLR